ncbi:MAG: GNAT family N-acetyltransferase, partial [Phycicoccus sp.]
MTPRRPPRGRPTFTTERLVLRPLSWDDLADLEALDTDPAVMRYLDRPQTATDARDRTLARLDPGHDAMGLGHWVGHEKHRFVGCWLLVPHGPGLAEIGWRLHPWAWGRGLATEGA